MGWHLDGRVIACVGTHTHVPTADARVLPGGTAYVTDVGMTGPRGGVIGVKREQALERFLTLTHVRFETSDEDPWLNAVVVGGGPPTGGPTSIEQLLVPGPSRSARQGQAERARAARDRAARPARARSGSRGDQVEVARGELDLGQDGRSDQRRASACMRHASASAPSGTSQIMYWGESTLPSAAKAQHRRRAPPSTSRRAGRRDVAGDGRRRSTPPARSSNSGSPRPATRRGAGAPSPSERMSSLTLSGLTRPERVEARGRAMAGDALDLHRALEVVADGVERARRARRRAPRRAGDAGPRAARPPCGLPRAAPPRPTSQASATGAATSGKPLVIAPRPSTASPERGRPIAAAQQRARA